MTYPRRPQGVAFRGRARLSRGRVVHYPTVCRGPWWASYREAILERDGWTCAYCGDVADTVDHVIPQAKGGDNHPHNLTAACSECNAAKGDMWTWDFLFNRGAL